MIIMIDRICPDDEDENDDVLVELGCRCKGQMSRMHRKCILEWYGLRMILEKNYNCELCK
jgi:E3 ubiquitin-protein ligase DOA10